MLTQAKQASQANNYVLALALYREAYQQEDFPLAAHTSYAWEIWRALQVLSTPAQAPIFIGLVREYGHLSVPKPSVVHSRILQVVLKFPATPEFKLLGFLQWWGADHLRTEDFEENEYQGRKLPALAEKYFNAYAKQILAQAKDEAIRAFIPQLDCWISQHPAFTWLPYYQAQLLLKITADLAAARQVLIPFVRQKKNESWAWAILSKTFGYADPDAAMACLCRALACPVREEFVGKVRTALVRALLHLGWHTEAKTELSLLIEGRKKNQQAIPADIHFYTLQHWFTNTDALPNNTELYARYSPLAEELIFEDCGEVQLAVVESVNKEKGLAYFVVDKNIRGHYKTKAFPLIAQAGDCVRVRLRLKEGKEGSYYEVLTVKETMESLPLEMVKPFKGCLRRANGGDFGFVEDVFVHGSLLESHSHTADVELQGLAVISFNSKKDSWGWKALKIW